MRIMASPPARPLGGPLRQRLWPLRSGRRPCGGLTGAARRAGLAAKQQGECGHGTRPSRQDRRRHRRLARHRPRHRARAGAGRRRGRHRRARRGAAGCGGGRDRAGDQCALHRHPRRPDRCGAARSSDGRGAGRAGDHRHPGEQCRGDADGSHRRHAGRGLDEVHQPQTDGLHALRPDPDAADAGKEMGPRRSTSSAGPATSRGRTT